MMERLLKCCAGRKIIVTQIRDVRYEEKKERQAAASETFISKIMEIIKQTDRMSDA